MSIPAEQLVLDLAPFADLGTYSPNVSTSATGNFVRLVRNGVQVELVIDKSGPVLERREGEERKHHTWAALLASPNFADLGRWADSQRLLLEPTVSRETLPVTGRLLPRDQIGGVEVLDAATTFLPSVHPRVQITLIDGPAGIGKTSLIRIFAHSRAEHYRTTQKPLVLHVESRGRMLQNVTDLMAFSLQTMRLGITYDQIPVLVRNGLIVLAIDGFDELGDPSGYQLAWAQVNELIAASRGAGRIILSGRETFIGKDRLAAALNALDDKYDQIQTYGIVPLRPSVAQTWLKQRGWSEATFDLETVKPLFEQGSYALRPFFVSELSRPGVEAQIREGQIDDLLPFLINAMIEREAGKFGKDVEAVTTVADRGAFIKQLMEEVARDLAENQSDAISSESLAWLAEVVAADTVPSSLSGILRNRAEVIAFLTEDVRRGYRRFVHGQVQNYFLSKVTLSTISKREVPKYIRRNILGTEFLENFSAVARRLSESELNEFVSISIDYLSQLTDADRSRRNLAALVMSVCSAFTPSLVPEISDVGLDEAYMGESVSRLNLRNVTIAQLFAKSADLRDVEFDQTCHIVSLVADESFIPSGSLPDPAVIDLPDRVLTDPAEIGAWLRKRYYASREPIAGYKIAESVRRFALFDLLLRVARYKPFWIKDSEERTARRILDDPHWDKLKELMIKHDLLVERTDVPAAGRPAIFYHVKNREALMLIDKIPDSLKPFIQEVFEESLALESDKT